MGREFVLRDELIARFNRGERLDFLPFWGPKAPAGLVTEACLCQWYEAAFELEGDLYPTAEHYMMAEKARLFGDGTIREQILALPQPADTKVLGRRVKGFDEGIWSAHRFGIVVRGNLAKFSQNPRLGQFLRNSGDLILVEASPVDAIWGVGLAANRPEIRDPNRWRGRNLLGFALMEVRRQLATS